jgi:hypothetical protein
MSSTLVSLQSAIRSLRTASVLVDVFATYVPRDKILEPVGVVLDDPLPDLLGGPRELAGVARPVSQLPNYDPCSLNRASGAPSTASG